VNIVIRLQITARSLYPWLLQISHFRTFYQNGAGCFLIDLTTTRQYLVDGMFFSYRLQNVGRESVLYSFQMAFSSFLFVGIFIQLNCLIFFKPETGSYSGTLESVS